jgi:hypothetical protein
VDRRRNSARGEALVSAGLTSASNLGPVEFFVGPPFLLSDSDLVREYFIQGGNKPGQALSEDARVDLLVLAIVRREPIGAEFDERLHGLSRQLRFHPRPDRVEHLPVVGFQHHEVPVAQDAFVLQLQLFGVAARLL